MVLKKVTRLTPVAPAPTVDLTPIQNELAKLKLDIAKTTPQTLFDSYRNETNETVTVIRSDLTQALAAIPGLRQSLNNQNSAILELKQQSADTSGNILVPDSKWIETNGGNDMSLWYKRSVTTAITEVSFEFCHPTDLFTVGKSVTTDFNTDFSPSGFWGGKARFLPIALPNGRTIRTVLAIDGMQVTLHAMDHNATSTVCRIRNVRINGLAQDFIKLRDRFDVVDINRETTAKAATLNEANIATNATNIANNQRLHKKYVTVANSGTAVNVGDKIQCQVSTTGNRSLQLKAVSTAVTWVGWSQHSIENGTVLPTAIASHSMTTTWEYAIGTLTFARQNDFQIVWIEDTTNSRKFKVTVHIGSSFNSNHFIVEEYS